MIGKKKPVEAGLGGQALEANNIVNILQVRARKNSKFLAARCPASGEKECSVCGKCFPDKQNATICPGCTALYLIHSYTSAAAKLLQEVGR